MKFSPRCLSFGFTLTEVLVVIGLLGMFTDLALTDGIGAYDRGLAQTDRQLLLAALREARAQSIHGICTNPACIGPSTHGVRITENQLTIFEGSSYAARYQSADESLSFSGKETVSNGPGMASEITFAPNTADVSTSTTIVITGSDHRIETVYINTQGAITASTI